MGQKLWNEFGVPHEVFEDADFKKLSHRAIRLYCYLAKLRNRYANEEGWFYRSIETLAYFLW